MLALVASITALLLSTAVLMVGSGLLGTLLSVRLTVAAIDSGTIGLVMGAYFLGLMLGAVWAANVVRRAGHIRAFAIFAAVVTAATLVHGLRLDPWTWAVLRVLSGFSLAGLYMVIESWLNERGQGGARGRLFSLYQIISYLGLGTGQFLLGVAPVEGTVLFMITALAFALCLIPVSLTRSPNPTPPEHHRMALWSVLRRSPVGSAVCVGAGAVNGAAFSLAPVFVLAHTDVGQVPYFMGAMILGGMLLQYPIGHLSDLFDRQRLIATVNGALVLAAATLWFAADKGFLALAGAGVAYGGLTFTLYPLAVAQVTDRVQTESFVGVAAALLMLWGLGAVAGPVVIGGLMDRFGADALVFATSGVGLLLAAAALLLRRDALAPSEQSAFVTMVRTTPAIANLDPRTAPPVDPQRDWIDDLERADAAGVEGDNEPA